MIFECIEKRKCTKLTNIQSSFVDVFCTFGLDYNTIMIDEVILSKKYSILFLSKEILAYPKQLKV